MTPELATRLRAQLEQERASTIDELREYGADPDSEKVDKIAGVDDNFADLAQATAERSEILALIDQSRTRLAEVQAALAKMDEGTYGVCEDCGGDIAEVRLEALPLAVRCMDCANRR